MDWEQPCHKISTLNPIQELIGEIVMMGISPYILILTTVALLIGVLGNVTALWILYKTANRRNKKHLFLLRCLAINDLIAQIGMLNLIYLGRYQVIPKYWNCVGFVLIRAFGLGSGCVAFIMAFERWLALTRPFLYHQVFTYQILKRLLCGLWLTAVILTYLPLFGFGLYYNKEKNQCERFRCAVEVKDKIYAYLFFAFGAILCICIALCNVAVICELLRIRSQQKVLVRRISRSIIVNSDRPECPPRYHTPEEMAFAKLMAFICLIFVVCWAPQVISVPVSQYFIPPQKSIEMFEGIADTLLTVYFVLDPFVYVLQNYFEGRITNCCFFKKSTSSVSSNTNDTEMICL